ncbi:ATP-binding protein [Cellvibrio sp. KY-GH-1]|uniref:ATP-binding protein n=1 Tax=Cellvibrio sp. KY-GH-1 TaxID=2303332 RepID=UPI001781AF05|nr:ATP-binding protein [Cellvibrio sp. KY-GH-1]
MHLTVGKKLWLAFVGTITLCVLALYLLLHNSLKQGFLDYTSQQSVQRLEILRSALASIYREEGSFDALKADADRWLKLKDIIFAESDALFSGLPEVADADRSAHTVYREFVSSISLADVNRQVILGVVKPEQELTWVPVTDLNKIIGFISFEKPKVVTNTQDQNFIEHQFKVFSVISLLVLVIATLVATLFARRISRPLMTLAQKAHALASGDYSQKIPVTSRDEIGQVCNSFNQLSEALAANQQSRALWVADISHEMRTPLSVLKVQIEAMQDGIRPANAENLALLYDKALGLSKLIDDLFELSLSDVGALSYHKQTINLVPLLKTCIEHFQAKAQQAGLRLQDQLDHQHSIWISADRDRLQQLFSNLLENSFRYTHSPGAVSVALTTRATHVEITIDDSPPGIAPDQYEKVFERLYRVENSRSRQTGGAGLGLAICKNIVEAHQGTISANESALGGLQIRINLPLVK